MSIYSGLIHAKTNVKGVQTIAIGFGLLSISIVLIIIIEYILNRPVTSVPSLVLRAIGFSALVIGFVLIMKNIDGWKTARRVAHDLKRNKNAVPD